MSQTIAHKIHPYFADGEWKVSQTGQTVPIYSPYLEGEIGQVQALSQEEVDTAITSAHVAQKNWADTDAKERGRLLKAWADALVANKEEIATTIMNEVGKNYADAEKEVVRTADLIRFTVEEFLHTDNKSMSGENFPGGSKNKFAIIERVPVGVVLAISPFNYPVNLSVAKLAPALMAGNGVIFKPATQGSISAVKIIESFASIGFPKGILQLVTGRGSVIGDYIVAHEGIDMISFTGGTAVGRRMSTLATMTPMVLELGGKDPGIVTKHADLDRAVNEIMLGAFSYSGQRCTAIKRVLVEEEVADSLAQKLTEAVKALKVGMPTDGATIVPVIDSASADFVQGLVDDAKKDGATILAGDKREGNLIYPTLLDNVTLDMRIAWEEPFGPLLPIIRVKSVDEAIKIANDSEYGLQASVFTENFSEAISIARKIEAGSVQVNGRPERGPDSFPFLGVKNSGMGVQGVGKSLESMTREKLTVINL